MGLLSGGQTFDQLARDARGGDSDAALMLAKQAPCKGFLSFLARWVPEGEMTVEIFDRFSDSYQRMEMDRLDAQCKDIPEPKEA